MGHRANEKMVQLNNAWAVISDEEMRAAYDRSRVALAPRTVQPQTTTTREFGRAAPTGTPTIRSSVLDFGRYQGWTLDQVARQDPNFLEWLARMPIGRPYRTEIDAVLARVRVASKPASNGHHR